VNEDGTNAKYTEKLLFFEIAKRLFSAATEAELSLIKGELARIIFGE
jgi:hypothetical protein